MQPPWPRDMTGDEDAFSPPGVCGPFTGGACSLLLGGQRSVSTPFLLWLLSNLNSKYHYSRAAYFGATCHRTHQRGFPWPLRGWLWKSNAFVQGNTPWEMQSAQEQRVVPIQTWPFPKHSAPFPAFRALPHTPTAGKSPLVIHPVHISVLQRPNLNVTWSLEPPRNRPHSATLGWVVAVLTFWTHSWCNPSQCHSLPGLSTRPSPAFILHSQNILT